MAKRIGGFRRKTRFRFRKNVRDRGKISLKAYLQTFKMGEKVNLIVEPAVHKGMYYPRFMGKTGIVKGKRGRCYEISINDANKEKTLIVHPIHLKKAEVK